jgi:ankyrin repeat protein
MKSTEQDMHAIATMLLYGLHENDLQAVRRAIAQGADLTTAADPRDPEQLPPLMLAAKWGNTEMCHMLMELGADPHRTIHGKLGITAIGTAAYYARNDVCRLFIERGATPDEIQYALDLAKSGALHFGQGLRAERYSATINVLQCALGNA